MSDPLVDVPARLREKAERWDALGLPGGNVSRLLADSFEELRDNTPCECEFDGHDATEYRCERCRLLSRIEEAAR